MLRELKPITQKWREEHRDIESAEKLLERIKSEKEKSISRVSKKNEELPTIDPPYELPQGWCWVRLKDIFKITSGGTPSRSNKDYFSGNIPWIKTGEINWNYINSSEEYISSDAVDNSSAKLLPIDTVVVAMYGQGLTRGRAAILNIEATCNQAVCALLPNSDIESRLLFYYFMEGYHRFRNLAKGGNQENLSASVISDFLFPLMPIEEQRRLIKVLNRLLSVENEVYDDFAIILDDANIIIQSILSKAFRGELGTNNSKEESALDMLKQVL